MRWTSRAAFLRSSRAVYQKRRRNAGCVAASLAVVDLSTDDRVNRTSETLACTVMKVVLRNPRREVELPGPLQVGVVLRRLDVNPESVIVIRGDELITSDTTVADDETIELRPVISGGAPSATERSVVVRPARVHAS
jgi:sulfur carrier protein